MMNSNNKHYYNKEDYHYHIAITNQGSKDYWHVNGWNNVIEVMNQYSCPTYFNINHIRECRNPNKYQILPTEGRIDNTMDKEFLDSMDDSDHY
jgi:hypothetical protein